MSGGSVPFLWRELVLPRPLDEQTVTEGMRRLADDPTAPQIAFEVRSTKEGNRLLVGAPSGMLGRVASAFGGRLSESSPTRVPVDACRTLRIVPSTAEFASDGLALAAAGLYQALTRVRRKESLVVQLVLGRRLAAPLPSMLGNLLGQERHPDRTPHQPKRFEAAVRVGVTAKAAERRKSLLLGVFTALRRAETPEMRFQLTACSKAALHEARLPWRGLLLSVREAAAVAGFPIGAELSGLPPLHPRLLAPSGKLHGVENGRLVLAMASAPNVDGVLTIDTDALLRGVHLLGPMGSGKSDVAAQLALQWIEQGNAAVVFEPKRDLSDAIAARVSKEHRKRIAYFDLQAEGAVIGFNPLKLNGRPPELVVDELVSIFATVLSDVIGITTRDILNAALLTLVQYPNATLLMLPLLLSDARFRRQAVANIADDVFLSAYWAEFEGRSEQSRNNLILPVLTRLRQVLLRKAFRDCLGQANPRFDVRQTLGPEKKVLLAPLPEAQLGKEGVALLGSLLLHATFGAVRERATVPPAERHPVMIVVDEWHRFVRTGEGFEEALTLFRGYGAGFVLCNQVLKGQLSAELRDIVLGAVRSHVYFQLGPDDAATVVKHDPELLPIDVMRLGKFHIYAGLHENGSTGEFVSGTTIKLPKATASVDAVRRASSRRYGIPRETVAATIADLYGTGHTPANQRSSTSSARIGRRPTTNTKGDES